MSGIVLLYVIVASLVGGILGMLAMACMVAGAQDDERAEKLYRERIVQ